MSYEERKRGGAMATPTVVGMQSGSVVKVIIQVDRNGEVDRDPGEFTIYKSLNQQVLWEASDGKSPFNIDFVNGSPFAYTQFSNAEPYSGLVRREVLGDPGRYYKYTVRTGAKHIDPGGYVK
jgi:hypothetical protein